MTIIKRADADAVLQRVALLSFLYYPEVQLHEPDYSLSDDIEFCLEPVGKLDEAQREELHQLFGQAIINPSEYRVEVFAVLDGLVTEGSDEK